MKLRYTIGLLLMSIYISSGQADSSWLSEIKAYHDEMNRELADSSESPLPSKDLADFQGVEFYDPDPRFRVEALLILTPESKPFEMTTTTKRKPVYRRYAMAVYKLDTLTDTLDIYQNLNLMKREEYKDYLFLPFNDLTNGFETYGGGRYLDFRIPESDTLVIDFNKAYNPYCAYHYKYSCPVPPRKNFINYEVTAGVKDYHLSE